MTKTTQLATNNFIVKEHGAPTAKTCKHENGEVELEEEFAFGGRVLGRVPVEDFFEKLPRGEPFGGFVDVGHLSKVHGA